MKDFRMPALGADMDAGTLVEWLKKPGDVLKRGDVIAVVETQKGAIEIEVFDDGVLSELIVDQGREVPVGTVLAKIEEPKEKMSASLAAPQEPAPDITKRLSATFVTAVEPEAQLTAQTPAGVRATPAARRAAQQGHLDINAIKPGPDGIIGLRELDATAVAPAKQRRGAIDHSEMRKAIAAAMARANAEIPHYYVTSTIDMTPMIDWLARYNTQRPVDQRLHYAVPLLRAIALCLRRFSDLNGLYAESAYTPAATVNIGVAVATRGGGLITPAIVETDTFDLPALMTRLNDLVKRVRGGRLRSSELSQATVTVTNLGDKTADVLMPIIYPPQVAIIGCGQIRLRPWVVDEAVVPRQLMDFTLAGDHRVSDGRIAARFLSELSAIIARPEAL